MDAGARLQLGHHSLGKGCETALRMRGVKGPNLPPTLFLTLLYPATKSLVLIVMKKKRYVLVYLIIPYANFDHHFQIFNMSQIIELQASELKEGATILCSQLMHKCQIWMCSTVNCNVGGNVSDLVCDVCHLENMGQLRENTWALSRDHNAQHQSCNTMGYQVCNQGTEHSHGT